MTWPNSTALTPGQTAGVSTTFNALRSDLANANLFAIKTADQGTTTTALANDTELVIAIPAVGTYIVEAVIAASSAGNAAGDIKIGAIWPTATVHQFGWSADPALASGSIQAGEWKSNLSAASGSTISSYGLSTATTTIYCRWLVIATGTGNFRVQFGQVSGPTGTSTIKAGSHMTMRQVA